ncbi:MAG: hypothetical protein JWR36_1668 [Glaciihabitans sp.]|nr:hypothetical protein [Glaciihabitans sp.]
MDVEPITVYAPPLPGRSSASQRWSELAFLHWRVDPNDVAPLLPPGIRPDEFDGSSWVGLIAFALDRATLLGSPPIPYFGTFVEVNVRLYGVDAEGRRGVVFASLEASRLAAVLAARGLFSLPYYWSKTTMERPAGNLRYSSRRHGQASARSTIEIEIGAQIAVPDPLSDFLTSRWGLFVKRGHRTVRLRNWHEPWLLHDAELVGLDDSLIAAAGLAQVTSNPPDSVLYSPGVTTRFGPAA